MQLEDLYRLPGTKSPRAFHIKTRSEDPRPIKAAQEKRSSRNRAAWKELDG